MTSFGRISSCLALIVVVGPVAGADTDKYLPDRTQAVVTVRVKQVLEAPLLKEHAGALKKAFKDVPVGQAALQLVGFDPFTDLEQVVVAFSGNPDNERCVCLLQGPFDNAKIQAAAEKNVGDGKDAVTRHKAGEQVFYGMKCDADSEAIYFGLLDAGLVVASADREAVVEALDKKAGKRKAELRRDVQQLLTKADARHAVAVASLSQPLNFGNLLGNIAGNLQNVTGGVVLGDDLKVEMALAARDVANAKAAAGALEDHLNQAKALVAVLVTQKKEFAPLADALAGVKVSAKGSDVAFRVTVSKDLIDSLFKKE